MYAEDILEDLRSQLDSLINEVQHHLDNGHKELSTNWVLNQLREIK